MLTDISVDNIVRIGAKCMALARHWGRATARRILGGTGAAMHIGAAYAVRRGALIQAQIDGAVAVVAKI